MLSNQAGLLKEIHRQISRAYKQKKELAREVEVVRGSMSGHGLKPGGISVSPSKKLKIEKPSNQI